MIQIGFPLMLLVLTERATHHDFWKNCFCVLKEGEQVGKKKKKGVKRKFPFFSTRVQPKFAKFKRSNLVAARAEVSQGQPELRLLSARRQATMRQVALRIHRLWPPPAVCWKGCVCCQGCCPARQRRAVDIQRVMTRMMTRMRMRRPRCQKWGEQGWTLCWTET